MSKKPYAPEKKTMSIRPKAPGRKATVACHGCGGPVEISIDPITIRTGPICNETFIACRNASYLCPECREDSKKLSAAYEAFEKHYQTGPHDRAWEKETGFSPLMKGILADGPASPAQEGTAA